MKVKSESEVAQSCLPRQTAILLFYISFPWGWSYPCLLYNVTNLEVAEGRCDQEIVTLPVRAETRIGIPARQDGIVHRIGPREGVRRIDGVLPLVGKVLENGDTRRGLRAAGRQETHEKGW